MIFNVKTCGTYTVTIQNRPDDPIAIAQHKDRFYGGVALCILGGPSGQDWEKIRDEVQPDCILTANGNTSTPDVNYWMLAENMNYSYGMARNGSERYKDLMKMVNAPNSAEFRLVSHRSWNLLHSFENTIRIRRVGWEKINPDRFTLREYGDGFFYGPIFSRPECVKPKIRFHVGTVAAHLLHMAGILGVSTVHTIGMDFCFKKKHHWYKHPKYEADRFRTEKMFVEFRGLQTQWDWIEGAKFYKSVEHIFVRDGLEWIDHSDGLLQAMGVR